MKHLNPVYKRELKQTARTRRFLLMVCIYNLLLAAIGLFGLYLAFERVAPDSAIRYADVLKIYLIMVGLEFGMILLIVPAVTAGAIAGEKEKQTLDILLSTRVSCRQVVLGKLAASISMVILLVISSLPVVGIVFAIGGIGLMDMLQFLLLIIVTAVFLGSVGIFFSTCYMRRAAATVAAYAVAVFIVFLLPAAFVLPSLIEAAYEGTMFSFRELSEAFYGKKTVFLLFSPFATLISMLREQTGHGTTFMTSIGSEGGIFYYFMKHWYEISLFCQLVVSAIMLGLAARRLNPVRGQEIC